MKVFGLLLAMVVLVVVVLLIVASTKPDFFKVERSAHIQAGPASVVPWIADFRKWRDWSPWEGLDSNLHRTYSGSDSGVGAKYAWEGARSGKGSKEITGVDSRSVTIRLDFEKPFAARNEAVFAMEPSGAGTKLVWTMTGPNTLFPGKIMQVFVSMDRLIGKDFEKGLAGLKKQVESQVSP